jgi:hypothetical protein
MQEQQRAKRRNKEQWALENKQAREKLRLTGSKQRLWMERFKSGMIRRRKR